MINQSTYFNILTERCEQPLAQWQLDFERENESVEGAEQRSNLSRGEGNDPGDCRGLKPDGEL